MCFDVIFSGDENRTGLEIAFSDPERILYPPKSSVDIDNFFLRLIQFTSHNSVIAIILLLFGKSILIGNEEVCSIIDQFTGGWGEGELFHIFGSPIGGCSGIGGRR